MTTTQPQPAPSRSAIHDPVAERLLNLWVDLTRRVASAAAHGDRDEPSLRNLQLQVEEAITDRLPDGEAAMAELIVWESTLIHIGETPPGACLICVRARLGLPSDVPLPIHSGSAR